MKKLLSFAAMIFPFSAFAETSALDVTDVVAYLDGDVTTAIAGVGSAIILLAVVAVGFKWIKGMIFG